jgi:hypothetical protein
MKMFCPMSVKQIFACDLEYLYKGMILSIRI